MKAREKHQEETFLRVYVIPSVSALTCPRLRQALPYFISLLLLLVMFFVIFGIV